MNTNQNNKLIIAKEDLDLISEYLEKDGVVSGDKKNKTIIHRLENAQTIEGVDFPWEIVRLNSKVIIRDKIARLNYTYIVVMPELADHKQCRVSLFSTIGSTLFGNSRGTDIYWETPKGKRYFTIMAVSQYSS